MLVSRFIGIDYGAQRVGLATGDDQVKLASPWGTVLTASIIGDLRGLIATEQPRALILGLPRGLDSQDTAQTKVVRQLAQELEKTFGLPVHLQDESVTSELAYQRGATKDTVDAVAASIILQDYLDSL